VKPFLKDFQKNQNLCKRNFQITSKNTWLYKIFQRIQTSSHISEMLKNVCSFTTYWYIFFDRLLYLNVKNYLPDTAMFDLLSNILPCFLKVVISTALSQYAFPILAVHLRRRVSEVCQKYSFSKIFKVLHNSLVSCWWYYYLMSSWIST